MPEISDEALAAFARAVTERDRLATKHLAEHLLRIQAEDRLAAVRAETLLDPTCPHVHCRHIRAALRGETP